MRVQFSIRWFSLFYQRPLQGCEGVTLEGENGHFLWAVWLNILCICLSRASYAAAIGHRLTLV
jgi:hypothetical protein